MSKNFDIALLFDFYGDMLTEKQRNFINDYYNEDLSLSEIASNEGITRQGVRDAIKRAENQLFEMEERLGLAARFDSMKSGLSEIIVYAEEIAAYNRTHSLSMEVNDSTAKIKAVAQTLLLEDYS
ncbi:MAG: DNA-binding protein [Ruminococcus sp.]|nr:DNA-binding protein [Candidatus Copronaster equi]